MLFILS